MISVIKESFLDIRRYKLTFLINLLIVSILIFLLIFITYIFFNINKIEATWLNNSKVIIFLKDKVNEELFINKIKSKYDVNDIQIIKKNYLDDLIKKSFPNNDIISSSDYLPSIILIDSTYSNSRYIYNELKGISDVDEIIFNSKFYKNFLNITKLLKNSTIIIFLFLLTISFILFFYSYRLYANQRKKEIEILKYLGSRTISLFLPYLFSSLLIGLIGSILGVLYYYLFIKIVLVSVKSFFYSWVSSIKLHDLDFIYILPICLLIIFTVVISSFISLNKVTDEGN